MSKLLILLPDIWSMGKGKGMPSIDKFLSLVTKENECVIFTTDQNDIKSDYNNALVFQINKLNYSPSNRYLSYLVARFNFLYINVRYVFLAIKLKFIPDVIYSASSVPILASIILKKLYNSKSVTRIYGTFLYERLSSKFDKIKKYEECLSFLIPADKYIITNDGTRGDIVSDYFGIDKSKVKFLVNGVSLNKNIEFSPDLIKKRYGIPHDHTVAICVSRLSSWKRVDRIVTAFNKLNNEKVSLIVFGDGPLRKELQFLSSSKNIHFAGSVSSFDIHEAMVNSDIFISMYDYSNVGNPLLEALSYRMCIITLDTGGTKDFIDGENGIIIEKRSEIEIIESLEKEVLRLLANPQLIEDFSMSASKFARNNIMSWEERIATEVNIVQSLVEKDG